MKGSSISVVLVTYNSAHCVDRCLESVERLLDRAEVVVVDNGSVDGSADVVRRVAPRAVVVEMGRNLGFGRACTVAAERAAGDVLLFVNPDVVLTLVDSAALDADLVPEPLGLVVPLLAGSTGAVPRHPIFRYRPWPLWLLSEAWEPLRPRELQRPARLATSEADAWAAGTLFLVRRDEFVAAGCFDPRFFLYAEDVDLSRRYRRLGLPIRLTTALVGEHAGAASSAEEDPDAARVAPIAWSILGALEYVSIWHGPRLAARAARLVVFSLQLQTLALRAIRRVPRATRKRRQVAAISAFLAKHAESDSDYCPGAAAALQTVL